MLRNSDKYEIDSHVTHITSSALAHIILSHKLLLTSVTHQHQFTSFHGLFIHFSLCKHVCVVEQKNSESKQLSLHIYLMARTFCQRCVATSITHRRTPVSVLCSANRLLSLSNTLVDVVLFKWKYPVNRGLFFSLSSVRVLNKFQHAKIGCQVYLYSMFPTMFKPRKGS